MTNKVLFVVAHPDDESLWIGGMLKFLSDRQEVDPYVLCVTGRHHPQRNNEFNKALDIAGIKNSFVAEEEIPNRGGIPLSNLQESIDTGISAMKLEKYTYSIMGFLIIFKFKCYLNIKMKLLKNRS